MSRFVNPWIQYDGSNGQPYDGGSVYFGIANEDPVTNPKVPYSDKAFQVPIGAKQTLNDAGDFDTEIFLQGFYSMSLFDKKGNFVRTSPEVEGATPDSGFYVENYDTFALAVAAAAGSQLFISTNIEVDASITCSGLTLRFIQGGKLKPTTGTVITLNCEIDAGGFEIFDKTAAGLIKGDFNGSSLNIRWWGAEADGVTDDTSSILDAITTGADLISSDFNAGGVTMLVPRGIYKVTSPLPIVADMKLVGQKYRGCKINSVGSTEPILYTATYSGGVFTDNLDQIANVNAANRMEIKNLWFEHNGGTITGNAPSGAAWSGVIDFANSSYLEAHNLRVDMHGDDTNAYSFKNMFVCTLYNLTTAVGSSFSGGYGLSFVGLCNNVLLERCRVTGGFQRGYSFDASENSMDAITAIECDISGIDYTDEDDSNNRGTGYAWWIGGATHGNRISAFRMVGGYIENSNVDILVGTSITGVTVENPHFQKVFHGDNSNSEHAYKLLNCSGCHIDNPKIASWNFQKLTLTSVVGTPVDGDQFFAVDRFGNSVKGETIAWDGGASIATIGNLMGDIDPASAVSFSPSGATGTITNIDDAPTYGTGSSKPYNVSNDGRAIGSMFYLTWYDAQAFKPGDAGLDNGTGTIKVVGNGGHTREYQCGGFWPESVPAQAPRYRSDVLTATEVQAANVIYKAVIPAENYEQGAIIKLMFYHQSALTSDPNNHNDMSGAMINIIILRAYNQSPTRVEFSRDNVANTIETGTLATVPPIDVTDFTSSVVVDSNGEAEIDIMFDASAADASTDNRLFAQGTMDRQGKVRIYPNV